MAAAPPQLDIVAIEQKHAPGLEKLTTQLEALKARPLTQQTAEWAQELDTAARDWLAEWEEDCEPTRAHLYGAWKSFTEMSAKRREPAELIRKVCTGVGQKGAERDGGIVGRYNAEQARIAAEKQREADRLALEQAERDRQAEADALAAQAAATNDPALLEEAVRIEQTPVIPVVTPVAPPPKVTGNSSTPKRIAIWPTDKVAFGNALRAYLLWALKRPDDDLLIEALAVKASGVENQLRRGLTPDGPIIKEISNNRNLNAR